jgi:hypothetical protein
MAEANQPTLGSKNVIRVYRAFKYGDLLARRGYEITVSAKLAKWILDRGYGELITERKDEN